MRLHPFFIDLVEVDSTNNYAAQLLKSSNPPNGSVITAQYQTNGKGQRGNHWQSDTGLNLICSIVYSWDQFDTSHLFFLNKSVAVAVAQVIRSFCQQPVSIKWPNDILLNDYKVAGVLIENNWKGEMLQSTIFGFGINVNQISFPIPHATSIYKESHQVVQVKDVLSQLRIQLDTAIQRFQSQQWETIDAQYHELLAGKNIKRKFQVKEDTVECTVLQVTDSGNLLVESNGNFQEFSFKEIQWLYY